MRRFMVHLVTEVEFEDGDEASDKTVQNYQKQASRRPFRNAAQSLLLRTVKGARIDSGSRSQKSKLSFSNPPNFRLEPCEAIPARHGAGLEGSICLAGQGGPEDSGVRAAKGPV